nr:SH3 domain-containing protein [Clostridia bacterium]
MANKTYTVTKGGETVKELKTLTAAKKLADEQGGEVLCDGETVYAASPIEPLEELVEERIPNKCTLLSKMNIRKAPSLKADKAGIAETGTVVDVISIENDWLHLANGTFILYGDGKFAKINR